jgi:protoheme IX farnesyltransferase
VFGIVLMAAGALVMTVAANPLAGILVLSGGLFYAIVYTVLLKRHTVQNIVIGGAAGAIPPLVGAAAVSGQVGMPAVWLAIIIFLWTPPHFWALALLVQDEYAKAGVPMMPNVHGERRTANEILAYSLLLVLASAVPVATGDFGLIYGAVSLAAGTWLALRAALLRAAIIDTGFDAAARLRARSVFLGSLTYLAAVCTAAVVDRLI